MIFSTVLSLYTSRVVLGILGVEDYGIYTIVGGIVLAFSFLQSSLSGATSRFLTYEHGTQDKKKLEIIFSNALIAHIVLAVIIAFIAETVGLWFLLNKLVIPEDRIPVACYLLHFSVASVVVSILTVPYMASVIANERMEIYAAISLSFSIINLIFALSLSYIKFDSLFVYALLSFIATLLMDLMYFIACFLYFPECRSRIRVNKSILKTLFSFTSWDLYGNMSVVARNQGVSIVLNLFFGTIVNAAVGIAAQVQNSLENFVNNFLMAIRPQITKSYAAKDTVEMINLIILSSKFSFILALFICLPLIIESDFILNIWLKNVPDYAVSFTQLCLLFTLSSIIFRPVLYGVHATGRIARMSFLNGTIYLLVIPITYFLFKENYPPVTPYICNVLLALVAAFVNLFTLKSYVKIFSISQFLKKSLIPCLIIGLCSSLISIFVHYMFITSNNWVRLFFVTVSSTFSILVLAYFLAMDDKIRTYVNKYVGKFFKKKV